MITRLVVCWVSKACQSGVVSVSKSRFQYATNDIGVIFPVFFVRLQSRT